MAASIKRMYEKKFNKLFPLKKRKGGHYCLQVGERQVILSATPSDRRSERNVEREVRKSMRDQGMVTEAEQLQLKNGSFETVTEYPTRDQTLGKLVQHTKNKENSLAENTKEKETPIIEGAFFWLDENFFSQTTTMVQECAEQPSNETQTDKETKDMTTPIGNNKVLPYRSKLPQDLAAIIKKSKIKDTKETVSFIYRIVLEVFDKDIPKYPESEKDVTAVYYLTPESREPFNIAKEKNKKINNRDILIFALKKYQERCQTEKAKKSFPILSEEPMEETQQAIKPVVLGEKVNLQSSPLQEKTTELLDMNSLDSIVQFFRISKALHQAVQGQDEKNASHSAICLIEKKYGININDYLITPFG